MPLKISLNNAQFMLSETPFYHISGPKGATSFVSHPDELTAHEYNSEQWRHTVAQNRDTRVATQQNLGKNFKPMTLGVVWVTHNVSSWVEYYYHRCPTGIKPDSIQCESFDTAFCQEQCRYFEVLTPTLVETSKKAMTVEQIQHLLEPAEWKQKVVLVLQHQDSIDRFVELANEDPSLWWRFGGIHMTQLPTAANPMDESLIVPSGIISSSKLLENQRVLDFDTEVLERWESRDLSCTRDDEKLLPLLDEIREANTLQPLLSSSSGEKSIEETYKNRLKEYIGKREQEGPGFFTRSKAAKIHAANSLLRCIDDPSQFAHLSEKDKAMLREGRLSDYAQPILAWLQKQNPKAETPSPKRGA